MNLHHPIQLLCYFLFFNRFGSFGVFGYFCNPGLDTPFGVFGYFRNPGLYLGFDKKNVWWCYYNTFLNPVLPDNVEWSYSSVWVLSSSSIESTVRSAIVFLPYYNIKITTDQVWSVILKFSRYSPILGRIWLNGWHIFFLTSKKISPLIYFLIQKGNTQKRKQEEYNLISELKNLPVINLFQAVASSASNILPKGLYLLLKNLKII